MKENLGNETADIFFRYLTLVGNPRNGGKRDLQLY